MKKGSGFLKAVPINVLITIALAVFVVQTVFVMYYNENNLAFASREAYNSLAKAASMAESGFASVDRSIPFQKEANGFLYPVLAALLHMVTGSYGLIAVLYVIEFVMMLFILVVFYKVFPFVNPGRSALAGTLLFVTLAPVSLSVFSGGDVSLVFLLFALNVWFAVYSVEKGHYTGLFVTAGLLCLCGYTGIVFALPSLVYAFLKLMAKSVRKNYVLLTAGALVVTAVVSKALMAVTFIPSFTMEFLQQSGIFDTKTFLVDTFFKDGFLWSKAVPPFLGLFFFFAVVMDAIEEAKAKKTTQVTFFVLVTAAAMIMNMFAAFSKTTDTTMFVPPFYFVMSLYAFKGIASFASLFKGKREGALTPNNILYGLLVFVIFYNSIMLFTKTFERANKLRFMAGNAYYEKFIER